MKRKSFEERIREIPKEFGKSWGQLAKEIGTKRQPLYLFNSGRYHHRIHLSTVEKFARFLGLIPIVFYKENEEIEDLITPAFFLHKEIPNYVGRVFREYRINAKLNKKTLGKITGICHCLISGYESGKNKPTIVSIEIISGELGLFPMYLMRRSEVLKVLKSSIKTLEEACIQVD